MKLAAGSQLWAAAAVSKVASKLWGSSISTHQPHRPNEMRLTPAEAHGWAVEDDEHKDFMYPGYYPLVISVLLSDYR